MSAKKHLPDHYRGWDGGPMAPDKLLRNPKLVSEIWERYVRWLKRSNGL